MKPQPNVKSDGWAFDALTTLRMRIADYRGRGLYQGNPNRLHCIFLHIPKTAGTSIARALMGSGTRHVPYFEYERANPKKFQTYFKFAFVRNPWDRLVSAYFFLQGGGLNEVDCAWAAQHMAAYPTFDAFIRRGLSAEPIMCFPHFRPQSYYIVDCRGKVMVDFLGRYETLISDFAEVARRLRRDCSLPLYNKGDHAHFSTYYDRETREIVARAYARDIEIFDYRFDG